MLETLNKNSGFKCNLATEDVCELLATVELGKVYVADPIPSFN